jgi:permuted papain-like amidase YaeF/Yiix C92 family enzyme
MGDMTQLNSKHSPKFFPACTWMAWFVCWLGCIGSPSLVVAANVFTGPPAAEDLQAGDLIWPKEPGAIVPYAAPGQSVKTDRELWERDRDEYLTKLKSRPTLTEDEKRRIEILQRMSYDDFLKVYTEDVSPEGVTPYGGVLGIGHVAIVRKIAGKPLTIVEAMWGIGVREISYDAWKAERKGQMFWYGRLKDADPKLRADIAEQAIREVGKPYSFWNFDLADEAGFYCSKLAWLMIRKATGIVVDDKPNPVRGLWFSPKQLLKSPHLEILQNPGNYGLPEKAGER